MGVRRAAFAVTYRATATGILHATPTALVAQVAAARQWTTTLGLLGV
jgi:hypothetical protein